MTKNSLRHIRLRPAASQIGLASASLFFVILLSCISVFGQTSSAFRIGEKITYSVSFEKFADVAYGETYVVSRGRLGDKDAVEVRGKFKTRDFLSAAFYLIDESRVVFASPETGLPLYVSHAQNGGIPKETVENYLESPTTSFDLLSLLYKIRASGGAGAATLFENGSIYTVTYAPLAAEKVKTDAGEFETSVINVQSDYFIGLGLKDFRIHLSTDEAKIPVLIRFKARKGEFKMAASSVQMIVPEPEVQSTPTPVQTPRPIVTPKPVATPTPYVENQPLLPELAFDLGEALEYKLSSGGQQIGTFKLEAKERKQRNGVDSLLLTATAAEVRAGNSLFAPGDKILAYVDPDNLAPIQVDINLHGQLSSLNNSVTFNRESSTVMFSGKMVDVPVGTQSLLSLLYAIRSYNLKPSRDASNPVNDTRVAVFLDKQPLVFTLRPSAPELIAFGSEKVSAQQISISTGSQNLQFDQLQIKIWLGNDERRLPLRISAGPYQADLILKPAK